MEIDTEELRGRSVVDRNGKSLGEVTDVDPTGWLTVSGGRLHRSSLVPVSGLSRDGDQVRVPFDAHHVHTAPHVELHPAAVDHGDHEPDEDMGTMRREDKADAGTDLWALYEHYGVAYGHAEAPAAADPDVEIGFGQVAPDGSDTSLRTEAPEHYRGPVGGTP